MSREIDSHLVTLEVQLNQKSFYVINQFNDPIEAYVSKLSNMHLLAQHSILRRPKREIEPLVLLSHRRKKSLEETLWNLGLQVTNEPGQPSTYREYTDNESNIDITALKGTLKDKKISWKVVPNKVSSNHNIIELDFDISTDRRQAKLKRLSYNLGKADCEMLCEELIRTEPSSLSSNPKELTDATEFTNWITKACDRAIPKTYINGWREITWWTSDLTKMKEQAYLYRRTLKKTFDLEARERTQNAFRILILILNEKVLFEGSKNIFIIK